MKPGGMRVKIFASVSGWRKNCADDLKNIECRVSARAVEQLNEWRKSGNYTVWSSTISPHMVGRKLVYEIHVLYFETPSGTTEES